MFTSVCNNEGRCQNAPENVRTLKKSRNGGYFSAVFFLAGARPGLVDRGGGGGIVNWAPGHQGPPAVHSMLVPYKMHAATLDTAVTALQPSRVQSATAGLCSASCSDLLTPAAHQSSKCSDTEQTFLGSEFVRIKSFVNA